MKIFDSHCHLDDRVYDNDLPDVIKRMEDAEVAAAMIVGIDEKSSKKAVRMAEAEPKFFASVGIHPHDAKYCSEKLLKNLRDITKSPRVRAWGEIGLDFNRMFSSQEEQEKCFIRQLEIAAELNLPLIFHERDSNGRFLEILNNNPAKERRAVVHCFTGNRKELEAYLNAGFYIGITGILTIETRGASLRKLVPLIPKNRILIETDSPFLTPAPEKNHTRRNEPAFVRRVLMKIAAILNENPASLADIIWENTCNLYDINLD